MQHRLEGRSGQECDCMSKVASQSIAEEIAHGPAHDVDRNGIHADHDQRKGPALPAFPLHERVKSGHNQQYQSSAIESVGRGPDALHDGTNACPLKRETNEQQSYSRNGEPAHFLFF